MKNGIYSVHALVRLLKSSPDPPTTSGPSKIEIARLAWSDPSFRATNKGEVIGEWILTLLGQAKKTRREKDIDSTSDPIEDSRYWTLLCDVLAAPSTATIRPTKTWVLPLLNRFRLDTIVVQLLSLRSPRVLSPARAALSLLWPLGEKKIGLDALEECLSAVLDACARWECVDEDLCWIGLAVVGAYRTAFANASNKKKFYNCFLTTHLSSWLSAVRTSTSLVGPLSINQLHDSVYAAGTETLFSLDALKQPLDTLFDALSSSTLPISPLPALPKLFTSYLSATQRHKSVLFVSATGGKEEVRKRGMEFVGRCWALIRGSVGLREASGVENWKSVVGVFEIVERERLFVVRSPHGHIHIDPSNGEFGRGGELALSEARDKAIEMLDFSSKGHGTEQLALCIRLLDVLVQIEYDFVGSVLERVLLAMANIPSLPPDLVIPPCSEFLTHILQYHIKTRTVHTYALALLGATASSPWASSSVAACFPLAFHIPALARALRTSLTLTQTIPLATAVLRTVESAWRAINDADAEEERVSKKRKVTEHVDKSGHEARSVSAPARTFSHTCRVAGTILTNLPANAYNKEGGYYVGPLWGDIGKLGWSIIWGCLKDKSGVGAKYGKKRKHAVKGASSALHPQVVAAAVLRLLYDVRAISFLLGEDDRLKEPNTRTLLDLARDEASDPELVLEIIRTLFWYVWHTHSGNFEKQIEAPPVFAVVLDILTNRLSSESTWTGSPAALTHDNLTIAVLYALTDRWIDVFNALASMKDSERLVSLLLSISLYPQDEITGANSDMQRDHVVTLHGILLKLLRNAQFWELHNIRAVLLPSVLNLTTPLSSHPFPANGVESPSLTQTELILACKAYGLLLHVPPEYFTRPMRAELIKRAMAGDVQICKLLENGQRTEAEKDVIVNRVNKQLDDRAPAGEFKSWSRQLTCIRVFLQRTAPFLNAPNRTISLAFVNHLLAPPSCITSPSDVLASATFHLIQSHVVNLLHSQEPDAVASLSGVISTLIAARPFLHLDSRETWTHVIVQTSVMKIVGWLTSNFDPASLSDSVKYLLKTLAEAIGSALSPHARILVQSHIIQLDQFPSSKRINAWSRMLSLMRWLGMNPQVDSIPLGLKLATSTISNGNSFGLDSETCSSVLGLLFQELWCTPDVLNRVHLGVVVGFYAASGSNQGPDIEHAMNVQVAQALKKLSVKDFSRLLDVLAEAIGEGRFQMDQRGRFIRLGRIMLHDAPQGTLKVIQAFTTRCFHLFTDRWDIREGSTYLKLQYLEFIARYCSDRPTAIRSIDVGSVWELLHKTLSGSSEHDTTTSFPIFQHIVTIIGTLVRLRRDLVVHTLPHLSLVLSRLMMLTRKIRPQLGPKQSKLAMDTFPPWFSASQPLTSDDVRALARLIISLATKTTPRTPTYGIATESQKAVSLAKPFSKHASYVLVAYVDAFNDPLCIIDAETRRALEPGLFALCEMVGEHSRDALMLSALDSGGKTIMKSLWKEYEKQRYVGKG